MNKAIKILFAFLALCIVPAAIYALDILAYFTVDGLKDNSDQIVALFSNHEYMMSLLFALLYIVISALPLPLVAILTVSAGMIFGLWNGLLIVSFANAIGGTCTFLVTRHFAAAYIQEKFSNQLAYANQEIEIAGFWYSTGLRVIPGIPFFIINATLGLSSLSLKQFYVSTQLGMLVILFLLVNAGNSLAGVSSLQDIFNTQVIVSLSALGLMPFLVRAISIVAKRILLNE